MIELSFAKAQELVNQAITEKGEGYVYEKIDAGCWYTREAKPSCLVGQVLVKAGIHADLLEDFLADNHLDGELAVTVFDALNNEGWLTADQKAVDFLSDIQAFQDNGVSWGEALSKTLSGEPSPNPLW